MGKIYHLKSKKMHKKCIFFISDTDTGAKKTQQIPPRAATSDAIRPNRRNQQREKK